MKENDTMHTATVKIDSDVLELVRTYKVATGFPIQRFIEESIVEKINRLPVKIKEKMGLKDAKKKK
jgi:predicted DNA binding CopG/RHH family protein